MWGKPTALISYRLSRPGPPHPDAVPHPRAHPAAAGRTRLARSPQVSSVFWHQPLPRPLPPTSPFHCGNLGSERGRHLPRVTQSVVGLGCKTVQTQSLKMFCSEGHSPSFPSTSVAAPSWIPLLIPFPDFINFCKINEMGLTKDLSP